MGHVTGAERLQALRVRVRRRSASCWATGDPTGPVKLGWDFVKDSIRTIEIGPVRTRYEVTDVRIDPSHTQEHPWTPVGHGQGSGPLRVSGPQILGFQG